MKTKEQRFWSHVARAGEDECWEWTGAKKSPNGYGQFENHLAHRYAYEITFGFIPIGTVMDHLCENKGCVNPIHLEPIGQAENMLRVAR